MKTSHLSLALIPLLAFGAAHAQSSVTLYGRINTTVEHQKFQGEKASTGLHSNSSYIGFRGTEDLGGGLKAGFVYEQKVDSTTGAATDGFGRQSELYLGGNFGKLRLGNYNSTAYSNTADYISMHNHDTGSSADALYAYIVPNAAKIGYVTPELGGFSLELGYGFKDNHSGKSPYDLSVSYKFGNFDLGGGFAKHGKAEAYTLRALYATDSIALGGYLQYDENGHGAGLGDRLSARLAAAYFAGASEFHANVGWADAYDKLKKSGATQFTLGYNYNLSKRTKLYGFYTRIDNARNASYGGAPAAGKDFNSFALGVRHLF
ncbi:MAG: porin [Comamonadaceae bacterium]|nr:porin [Comamonadaceae bacterium]